MSQSFAPGCGYLKPEEIEQLLDGHLDPKRMAEFETHIEAGCAECVTLAADLNQFRVVLEDGVLEREREEADQRAAMLKARLAREVRGISPAKPAGFSGRWLQAVAAVLVLSVAGWLVFRDGGEPGMLTIPLPQGETYVAQVKPFSKPPVLRGEKDLESLWYAAELAYAGGDYEQAEGLLREISRQQATSFDARLYRAISLLALGRVAEARELLAEARTLAGEYDLSTTSLAWFEGLAALSAGDAGMARSALEEAAGGTGEYAEAARTLLDRIEPAASD